MTVQSVSNFIRTILQLFFYPGSSPAIGLHAPARATVLDFASTCIGSVRLRAPTADPPRTRARPPTTMGGRTRRPLSVGEQETISTLLRQGKSLAAIGTILGRPKSTVAYAAEVARATDNGAKVDKRGRPKSLTERELRSLRRAVDENGFSTIRALTEKVNQTRTQAAGGSQKGPVSTWTVRRAVKAMGFESRVASKKPYLSDRNKAKRLVWCSERKDWTMEWASVFFSDESSYVVRDASVHRVWRRPGERYSPSRLRPTFKSGRQSVMVWGAFSALGRSPLVRCEGKMTAVSYGALLEEHVVPRIVEDYGSTDAAWFQEDLAPIHTAKLCKAIKQKHGIRVLPWMAQSPDLNPIENAWGELERRLRLRPRMPKTKDELFAALCHEWEAVPTSFFKALAESMPRRVKKVIEVGGASTKY